MLGGSNLLNWLNDPSLLQLAISFSLDSSFEFEFFGDCSLHFDFRLGELVRSLQLDFTVRWRLNLFILFILVGGGWLGWCYGFETLLIGNEGSHACFFEDGLRFTVNVLHLMLLE